MGRMGSAMTVLVAQVKSWNPLSDFRRWDLNIKTSFSKDNLDNWRLKPNTFGVSSKEAFQFKKKKVEMSDGEF